jgi:glyoxylase-like metal-dependent hydrolase (beta-lactamase superfamily II)
MSAIRRPGKINENTTLIDVGMYGVAGTAAVYLMKGEKRTCLVDGGTRTEARRIVRALKELEAFPPDMIIATHAHWDHAQGIPTIRREAEKQHKGLEVLASQRAVPLLADPSYNDVFDAGPYERIEDVTPLKEGDTIDLGGIGLRIYEVPGHSADHVAILDEKNRNLFVGDALGLKVHDDTFLPPFMPPLWDPEAFHSSISKLKQVDYESLCLAHFGFIYGDEAKSILDEAVLTCEAWWQLFDENADRLDDVDYMSEAIMTKLSPSVPDLTPVSPKIRLLLGLATGWSRLVGKSPPVVGEILLRQVVEMLATGYRVQQGLQRP